MIPASTFRIFQQPLQTIRRRLPAFPPIVWLVLCGTLLIRTGFFLVWPFLSVILMRRFQLAPSEIGLILGSSALVSSITGFWFGNLSDRFGRRDVMIVGCLGNVAAFVVLALADSVSLYALGTVLIGLARSAVETPVSGLISETIAEPRVRDLAFHWRYFLANVGAAVGPLIGFVFGLAAQQATFMLTAACYFAFAVAILHAFRGNPHRPTGGAPESARFRAAIRVIRADHRFLLVIVSTFLTFAAYAQVESTLIQYVNLDGRSAGIAIATAVVATNGATIIAFQFVLLRMLRDYGLHIRIQAGLLLMIAGFLACAMLPTGGIVPWSAAIFVLSLGEAILFPTLSLQAERLAPPHLRGSYFGALSMSGLGFAVGPPTGGALLELAGGPWTFVITAAAIVLAGRIYWRSHQMRFEARAVIQAD
jgi:MFS family permease